MRVDKDGREIYLDYTVSTKNAQLLQGLIKGINAAFEEFLENNDHIAEVISKIKVEVPDLERVGNHRISVDIILEEDK